MEVYTVAFIGHRTLDDLFRIEARLEEVIRKLLRSHEYVEFLVGRDGEFDQAVSSSVRRMKRSVGDCNSSLVWVLSYPTAEYENNVDSFHEYYDEVEICEESSKAHYKSAIQIRNRNMIDRADLVVCFVNHPSGGAFTTLQYAKKQGKEIINLAEEGA